MQPSKLKLLLGHHLATNSFGLGRLFYKSSCQLQNFRHHGNQNGPNLEGWSAKIKPKSKRKAKNRKLNWTVITAITVIENSINCYTSTKMFTVQKELVFALILPAICFELPITWPTNNSNFFQYLLKVRVIRSQLYLNPGTQLGPQNKDFGTVSQTDLTRV